MGFGGGVAQLVNAKGLLAQTDARAAAADQLSARFDVQAAALSRAAQGGQALVQALNDAVSTNGGAAVDVDLSLAFATITSALNERWNGQPLFACSTRRSGPRFSSWNRARRSRWRSAPPSSARPSSSRSATSKSCWTRTADPCPIRCPPRCATSCRPWLSR
jgi:hypothetical protein